MYHLISASFDRHRTFFNIASKLVQLHHVLDERLDDFLVRAVVVFNVLVQLLANVLVLRVHGVLGLPPRVRVHPVLDDPRLVARRQVNEVAQVRVPLVLDPLVPLHVHGLALGVRAVNRALVDVHAAQIISNNGAHALHNALRLRVLQVLQRDVQRLHKVAQPDGVLAVLVQKHVQIELRVVVRAGARHHVAVAQPRDHVLDDGRHVVHHRAVRRARVAVVLQHRHDHVLELRQLGRGTSTSASDNDSRGRVMHYQLHLRLLLRLLRLGARLPVKAQAGRELVALAALAPVLDLNDIHRRFQFFVRNRSQMPVIMAAIRK